MTERLKAGQSLARGVSRHLRGLGFSCLLEFSPSKGLRADVIALGQRGELWIVECKSSRSDFQADKKWLGYLAWCDQFFWAVDLTFPTEILPPETGLIIADSYDAEIARHGPVARVAAARRKTLTQRFAVTAASRLQRLTDPSAFRLG